MYGSGRYRYQEPGVPIIPTLYTTKLNNYFFNYFIFYFCFLNDFHFHDDNRPPHSQQKMEEEVVSYYQVKCLIVPSK